MLQVLNNAQIAIELRIADTSGDGKLSPEESKSLPAFLQGGKYEDLNKDGFLDADEIQSARNVRNTKPAADEPLESQNKP